MTTRKLQLPVSGFPQGLNTEASVLNVLPSEFMDGTINIEILPNGSVRRRKGVNFIGIGDSGNVIHEIVSGENVTDGLVASATYVKLTAPNGSLVERIVVFLNNEFRIYKIDPDSYSNFDTPFQTISLRPTDIEPVQIPHTEGTAIDTTTVDNNKFNDLTPLFNGDVTQSFSGCAISNDSAGDITVFAGKDWGSGVTRTITGFRVFSSVDRGFRSQSNPPGTVRLEADTTVGAGDGTFTTFTVLGSIQYTDQNGLILTKFSGIDTSTAYRYHRIRINSLSSGVNGKVAVAEIQFFEDANVAQQFAAPDQKYHYVSFASSGEKLYFTGRHLLPGWLEVDNDSVSLKHVNSNDVIIRNPDATTTNARVTRNNQWFECVESHTSNASNRPGDGTGNWQNFWISGLGPTPSGLSAWATATDYDTTMVKRYNSDISVTNFNFFPTQVAFYAGRIWYAGDIFFPNSVYFSQVIQSDKNINRFHTQADPFDTNDSVVIDSDGGVISLQGVGIVFQLLASGKNLFIGSNVGVSQITGSAGDVFKATGFSHQFVLNDSIGGPRNMVLIDQEIMVFGESGIWLSQTETSIASSTLGQALFANITDGRLTSFYNSTPRENKFSGLAVYDPTRREVVYLFSRDANTYQTTRNTRLQPNYFTHALVVDTRFLEETRILGDLNQTESSLRGQGVVRLTKGAFFLHEFPDNGLTGKPFIASAFIAPELATVDNQVIDNLENTVVDGSGNLVVAAGTVRERISTNIIIMSRTETGGLSTIKAALGNLRGIQFRDWELDNDTTGFAQSYESRILFGTMILGDIGHYKGGAYLTLVFAIVPDGGALFRHASDFSVNSLAAKWADPVQVYFPDRFGDPSVTEGAVAGHDHTWFKHRIRTRSRAIQFILENDADKDFHLIGYNYQFWNKTD